MKSSQVKPEPWQYHLKHSKFYQNGYSHMFCDITMSGLHSIFYDIN